VPAAALGAGVGAYLGSDQGVGGGIGGGALGTLGGLALGGPAAMKMYIKGGRGVSKAADLMSPARPLQTGAYPWLRMQVEEEQR
jgi:hypothetical protein